MAQLKDNIIDGSLEVAKDLTFKINDKDIYTIHPETNA